MKRTFYVVKWHYRRLGIVSGIGLLSLHALLPRTQIKSRSIVVIDYIIFYKQVLNSIESLHYLFIYDIII